MKRLFQYHLVELSYLFDENNLMTDPKKSTLCTELEKYLMPEDYIQPSLWSQSKTACVIDVMQSLRGMRVLKSCNTFGEYIKYFLHVISSRCQNSSRVDFVFDTYIEGSIKDSERERRATVQGIDISSISENTYLPTDLQPFWSSSANKIKLQDFIRKQIMCDGMQIFKDTDIVISGLGDGTTHCLCITIAGEVLELPKLESVIEEADLRIIPHLLDAAKDGIRRVVILSNDTDVLVLSLHFFSRFKETGGSELWQRGGHGDSTRYIPVHMLADKLGSPLCDVLPALHNLTGSDTNSKVGTKYAALKANPTFFLKGFGRDLHNFEDLAAKAEEYLVKVLSPTTTFKKMDELRYYKYYHAKRVTFAEMPPTSFSLKGHILRAFYATYIALNCVTDEPCLNPVDYGFEYDDTLLVPKLYQRIFPDDLPQSCTCGKCATKRCLCRKMKEPCCEYCNCRKSLNSCKNPH